MKQNFFILITIFFLLSFSFASAVAEFESFPARTYSTYKSDNRRVGWTQDYGVYSWNGSFDKCSFANGQDAPALLYDFNDDGVDEITVWSGNYFRIYNGSDCTELNSKNIYKSMVGTPTLWDAFVDGEYVFVAPDSDGYISFISIDSDLNILLQATVYGGEGVTNVGIACSDDYVKDLCMWISNNNRFCYATWNATGERSNVSTWTGHCANIYQGVNFINHTDTFKKIPVVMDIDNEDSYEVVVQFDPNNDGMVGLMMWDIQGGSPQSTFGSDGFVDNLYGCGGCSCYAPAYYGSLLDEGLPTPIVMDTDGSGEAEIVTTGFYAEGNAPTCSMWRWYAYFKILNSDGTEKSSSTFYTKDYGSPTYVPAFSEISASKYKQSCTGSDRTGLVFGFSDGGFSGSPSRYYAYDSQTGSGIGGLAGISDLIVGFKPLLTSSTMEETNDDVYMGTGTYHLCNSSRNPYSWSTPSIAGYYNSLADVDADGIPDIVATVSGTTQVIKPKGSGTFSPNQAPVINSVNASSGSPYNDIGSTFFYTYSATDNEGDPIYGKVNCDYPITSTGGWSSANVFDTSHDMCTYSGLGCKTAKIIVTDNYVTRPFTTNESELPYYDYEISIKGYCGDGVCSVSENNVVCEEDCLISTCGNSACDGGETVVLCPVDCASSTCGNANCELPESYSSCPADCAISTCGNGYCDIGSGETTITCPFDTLLLGACGDGACGEDETYLSCPLDCTIITCGNNVCNVGENYMTCPHDCAYCGNSICESSKGEDYDSCPADCHVEQELEIPLTLVDVEGGNLNSGLLPELYYGIRAFFSKMLLPVIFLSIVLMVAMVFILIANLLQKAVQNG